MYLTSKSLALCYIESCISPFSQGSSTAAELGWSLLLDENFLERLTSRIFSFNFSQRQSICLVVVRRVTELKFNRFGLDVIRLYTQLFDWLPHWR